MIKFLSFGFDSLRQCLSRAISKPLTSAVKSHETKRVESMPKLEFVQPKAAFEESIAKAQSKDFCLRFLLEQLSALEKKVSG